MQSKANTDEVGGKDQDNAGTQDRLMLRFCSDGFYRTQQLVLKEASRQT